MVDGTAAPLVAIEGLDGAGKNTIARALAGELAERHLSCAQVAFPRYGTLHADIAADALHGRLEAVAESAFTMALLFALDRQQAKAELDQLRRTHDVVLLDRYVASNAAYTAARIEVEGGGGPDPTQWVADLEFGRFALPRPALHIFLATPVVVAAKRAGSREADDPSRARDRYETDSALQTATAAAYARLAHEQWICPWRTVGGDSDTRSAVPALADEIALLVQDSSP